MEVVVADANIFVYLFLCNLLNKVLLSDKFRIKIVEAVFQEITDVKRRISRDYPELRKAILELTHNHASEVVLERINMNTYIKNILPMQTYYELEERGELDLGEIESIPLAMELNGKFLSNDYDAIREANNIQPGLGLLFSTFMNDLFQKNIINRNELTSLAELLDNF